MGFREDTLAHAAQLMRELDIGVLPVSDENDRLCGVVTDRDIVVKVIANGRDPAHTTCSELCEGTPRWVDADTGVDEILRELEDHQIKRLPVCDAPSSAPSPNTRGHCDEATLGAE